MHTHTQKKTKHQKWKKGKFLKIHLKKKKIKIGKKTQK